eukprot:TRINITY_DN3767_c0_g1_i1.p1 TRINITY_DN3767_c0_g1~~TRINITY_DN3767_c0_g1_i1.p1  ORF type:complete len:153 (+),score=33.24 TRINITY_DN3767_c0_g1_i1:56-514(+)
MSEWECKECEQPNDDCEEECIACGEPKPEQIDPKFEGFKVGLITESADIPKTKLREVKVDVGGETVSVVTNAPNAKEGLRTVVATVGATVEMDGEDVVLKKTTVGGRPSFGMLCNGPMLDWTGGDNKMAVQLPDSFNLGAPPPASRPRMDGK